MAYDARDYPPFAVTVDLVVLTVRHGRLDVLLVRRGEAPYEKRWALPGGFVRVDEDLDDAASRELEEETGLRLDDVHLEQLRTYGAARRDPRMRVVTVAHLAIAPDLPEPVAGSDAAAAEWAGVDELLSHPRRLAFDHATILRDGVERARAKLEYSSLALRFCADEFTVAELRRVYEVVWGLELDPRNFHRKVTGAEGFIVATGRRTNRQGGRPAELYRPGPADALVPPIVSTLG